MTVQSGTLPWMLRHELRLHWRGMSQHVGSRAMMIAVLVLLHLLAIPMALALARMNSPTSAAPSSAIGVLVTISVMALLFLMVSRTLITSVQILYARGDMDLLLSSPLAPSTILAARVTVIAVTVALEFGALILPFVNVFVLFGLFAWARVYVLLPALGMLAATIGVALALLLFKLFGARRTRVFAQIASAIIGVCFVMAFQLPNMLRMNGEPRPSLRRQAMNAALSQGESLLALPGQLLMSSTWWALLFACLCGAVFYFGMRALGSRFVTASAASAGVAVGVARATTQRAKFGRGARAIIIGKELRLIARDPWLLTQLLQQLVYLLPIGFIVWRRSSGSAWLWGAAIFAASTVASALAWITLVAEDAPELLKSAPVTHAHMQRQKLLAAMLPVIPIALLPLFALWRSQAWLGSMISLCALASALSCAALQMGDRVGKRGDFRARHRGNVARAFVEFFIVVAWCGVCALLVWLNPFA